jgi:hypothetical protein
VCFRVCLFDYTYAEIRTLYTTGLNQFNTELNRFRIRSLSCERSLTIYTKRRLTTYWNIQDIVTFHLYRNAKTISICWLEIPNFIFAFSSIKRIQSLVETYHQYINTNEFSEATTQYYCLGVLFTTLNHSFTRRHPLLLHGLPPKNDGQGLVA